MKTPITLQPMINTIRPWVKALIPLQPKHTKKQGQNQSQRSADIKEGEEEISSGQGQRKKIMNDGNSITHANQTKDTVQPNTKSRAPDKYFMQAQTWADDYYLGAVLARNRWRAVALFGLVPLSMLLLIAVMMLIPAQHLAPILVNNYENGLVSVQPLSKNAVPASQAQMQSEVVRYVINREAYSADAYDAQYALVELLSDEKVASQYQAVQSASNKASPINVLGNKGTRTVHVQSVVFLDGAEEGQGQNDPSGQNKNTNNSKAKRHLAEVNFVVTIRDGATGAKSRVPLTALIAWTYRGTPSDPTVLWQNWDGFTVTMYTVEQRNV